MDIDTYLRENNFDEKQSEIIKNCGEIQTFKKGDLFINEGQISDRVGFILEGLFYSYDTDDKGNKKIFRFYYAPVFYLVADYESFTQDTPTQFAIEALENARVFVLEKSKIESLSASMPQFASLYHRKVEQMLLRTLRVIRIFQISNTLERMRLLKKISPELFLKVPYSYLASYLGVHRNTFGEAMKRL